MNQTAAAASNASALTVGGDASALTIAHFAIIAVLAVLVIIGIIYGARLKRQRVQAERDVVAHAEEAGVETAPAADAADDEVEAAPSAPPPARQPAPATPPVAPAPPPLTDIAVQATAPEAMADEPAAPLPAPSPPASSPPADEPADDPAAAPVTLLKGLGPKVAARLGELGVSTVGQMAALDDDAAQALDVQLGAFQGRMARDRWIEQARFLAAGDRAGFEAVFGRL